MFSWTYPLLKSALRQVVPRRVTFFNYLDIPRSHPPLDLLLSRNRITDVPIFLEVDKPRNPVPPREAGDKALLVLIYAPPQVIRHARVQHARATCHDVDPIPADHLLASWI